MSLYLPDNDFKKLPYLFLEKLSRIFPASVFPEVLTTFKVKKLTTFRINRIKITRRKAFSEFRRLNIKVREVNWYEDAFILLEPGLNQLAQTELYRGGKIYVQNLSSMLPPLVLNPSSEDLILDLAAAPGSKTTQLASLMGNEGKIVAVEKDKVRFQKLLANLRLQGVRNVEVLNQDAIGIWRKYYEKFDKILLDAPCTSESRFEISRPRSYLYWNQLRVKRMSKKQKGLIVTAFKCLKPGGLLVYSTCTFSPEENEFVINYLIRKFSQFIKVERVKLKIKNVFPGIRRWNEVNFHPEVRRCVRIIPTKLMSGFFICAIKKIKPLPPL